MFVDPYCFIVERISTTVIAEMGLTLAEFVILNGDRQFEQLVVVLDVVEVKGQCVHIRLSTDSSTSCRMWRPRSEEIFRVFLQKLHSTICNSDKKECHDCEEIFERNRKGELHHGAYKTASTVVKNLI